MLGRLSFGQIYGSSSASDNLTSVVRGHFHEGNDDHYVCLDGGASKEQSAEYDNVHFMHFLCDTLQPVAGLSLKFQQDQLTT